MEKSIFYIRAIFILTILMVVIACCSLVQFLLVTVGDTQPIMVMASDTGSDVYAEVADINDSTDTWETVLNGLGDDEAAQECTGATCSISIVNNSNHSIRNWSLLLNVDSEFYLNAFWCGTMEIHQFRDGVEISELVDSQNINLESMKLEHINNTSDMFIRLIPGDYMIYYPSAVAKEDVVSSKNKVGIGYIAYFAEPVNLNNHELTYYNDKKFSDGILFDVIIILCAIWWVLGVAHAVSVVTYKNTKKSIEALTRSVIEGLSIEYKTLWLISVKDKTIRLIRNMNEDNIQNAINIAKDFEDYDYALKFYIDHYIDETDRERVWNDVEFDHLLKHLSTERFFTVNYLHNTGEDDCEYFQMAFTRTIGQDEEDNIILAYRDIDKMVRNEQEKQKILEEALIDAKKANEAKNIFLANMSHEIRTPINAIVGMNTMILRETNEESTRGYAKDIKTASATLLSIVNDILDFSKIESGKMEIIPNQYRLDSVINDLLNMAKTKAEEKKLAFYFKINPNTPAELIGDELRVKQIMMNILSNAIKYTNEGSVLWEIDYEDGENDKCILKVKVSDTGIGIKPENINKIGLAYERLDAVATRSIEGTGLGLSITRNLLERMDSKLQVESEYGEGSVFSFELEQIKYGDAQVGNNMIKNSAKEEKYEKFHASKAKVLVVDDVDMNLLVIKNLLKRVEIVPDTCLSGKDAILQCMIDKYDLILMDAMMPEMSGEETLKHIRTECVRNINTPVIVLTANAIVGAKESYLEAGFSDYLSKPVEGIELEDMIQKYLSPNLIEPVSDSDEAEDNADAIIIEKIENIDGINTNNGIAASGDAQTYINVCQNFVDTAAARRKMIFDYYEAADIDNYTIQVHALKSSARLIGADELSAMALELETAGRDHNSDIINQKTSALLDKYDIIKGELENVILSLRDNLQTEEKIDISDNKLRRKLSEFQELIEAFDFETAKELFNTFEDYNLPDDFKEIYPRIKALIAEVDYDEISKVISLYLEN